MHATSMIESTTWAGKRCTYGFAVVAAAEWMKSRFACLRDVHFIAPDRMIGRTVPEIMKDNGYGSMRAHYWRSAHSELRYQSGETDVIDDNSPAFLAFAEDATGTRPALFVASQSDPSPIVQAFTFATLAHEVGHLDDFEQRRNLKLGEDVDWTKAELFAHLYQVENLQIGNHPLAMFVALAGLRRMATRPMDTAYRRSALAALASPVILDAVAWLNAHYAGFGDRAVSMTETDGESGASNTAGHETP